MRAEPAAHRDREEPPKHRKDKIERLLDLEYNSLTGQPYSQQYKDILVKRKQLPAWNARKDFVKVCRENRQVILVGETGSGKTTQCPQYLLLAGLNNGKQIAVTQPRRVAATSCAQRVANEFDCPLGDEVGYTIRYDDCSSEKTQLKFCTDGMLLREALSDPLLSQYSYILLDEAHERTMGTDILFGVIKGVVEQRHAMGDPLHLVVMSATLDSGEFQKYFSFPNDKGEDTPAPIISIPGRTFPVDVFYPGKPVNDYLEEAIQTVLKIHKSEPLGDVLMFLTGEEEIESACKKLREEGERLKASKGELLVLPLYSSLSPHLQQKVFDPTPDGMRKVVVSTNVAETSITIDGVVYVVDPGFSKQKLYNPRTQTESLLVTEISQASAKQRAGRAGRTRPGKCYRLYPEAVFSKLEVQTVPEIMRASLNNMVIQLLKMGFKDLVHFDYFTAPAPEMLMRALFQLIKLEVIEETADGCDLTALGAQVAVLPLEPAQARMMIQSSKYNCVPEILTLCAMLSVPPPFMRPRDLMPEADRAKKDFAHQDGDHLTLLNVFNAWAAIYESHGETKNWSFDHFINDRSMGLALKVRGQLDGAVDRLGIERTSTPFNDKDYYVNVRKGLLNGYFLNIAHQKNAQGKYTIADRMRASQETVLMHPSSTLAYKPEFICYNEFALTTMQYIRTLTPVKGEWLLEVAPQYFTVQCNDKEDWSNYWEDSPFKTRMTEIQYEMRHDKKRK